MRLRKVIPISNISFVNNLLQAVHIGIKCRKGMINDRKLQNDKMLEDVVRDSYASVVWSHKIQEKQADIYAEKFKKMETVNIGAASLTSVGIVALIFTDPLWLKLECVSKVISRRNYASQSSVAAK